MFLDLIKYRYGFKDLQFTIGVETNEPCNHESQNITLNHESLTHNHCHKTIRYHKS